MTTYFVLENTCQYIPSEAVTGPMTFDETCEHIRKLHPSTEYRVIKGEIEEDFAAYLADE
jgi:hypothetical protein